MRFLLFLAILTLPLRASDPLLTGPGLDISLISENRSITAGKAFTVGLHIHHFPGFHTYWKSPGMVGLATGIEWELPEGFRASEIRWPYPENTFMGEYPCHGYERDVTLLVTITPPAKLAEESVTLKAKAQWMSCAKGCFPGFETLSMTLPVADKAIPDHTARAHIQKAQSELPEKKHKITAKLLSKPDAPEIVFQINGASHLETKNLYFFSADGQISSDKKPVVAKTENDSIILRVARSEFSPKQLKTLTGVLKIGSRHLEIVAR